MTKAMKIYLHATTLLLLCAALAGCQTGGDKKDKELSSIKIYLETTEETGVRSTPIAVLRDHPMTLRIDPTPILDERFFEKAALIERGEAFYIQIKYDWHGSLMLDNVTSGNPGKRIAIESSFGQHRWLAAPVVNHRISDGTLTFTPDATREEAERIVRGLNNLAKKLKRHKKYDSPPPEKF